MKAKKLLIVFIMFAIVNWFVCWLIGVKDEWKYDAMVIMNFIVYLFATMKKK